MAPVKNMTGTGGPSTHGKKVLAVEMFYRGRGSAPAATLLRQQAGRSYMVLYLLCRAVELVTQALLVLHGYDGFKPKLHRKPFGHNLRCF